MKNTIWLTCVWIVGATISNAAPSERTASFVRENVSDLQGQRITLDVVNIKPVGPSNQPSADHRLVTAYTWDEKEENIAGSIPVLLRPSDLDKAIKKYGSKPDFEKRWRTLDVRTERMHGNLEVSADGVAFIDLTGEADAKSLKLGGKKGIADQIRDRMSQRRAKNKEKKN